MLKKIITFLMEQPFFYRFIQSTLAGQGHNVIKKYLLKKIPKKALTILDQGCGTGEYALLFKNRYTGIDNNSKDIEFARQKYPGKFLVGSATHMKSLKNYSFDVAFAVGLHHHLTDLQAKKAIREALRVTKGGGEVIIVDAMLPKDFYNLLGLFLRRLDRGRFVRSWKETIRLVPKGYKFSHQILTSFPFDYIVINIIK